MSLIARISETPRSAAYVPTGGWQWRGRRVGDRVYRVDVLGLRLARPAVHDQQPGRALRGQAGRGAVLDERVLRDGDDLVAVGGEGEPFQGLVVADARGEGARGRPDRAAEPFCHSCGTARYPKRFAQRPRGDPPETVSTARDAGVICGGCQRWDHGTACRLHTGPTQDRAQPAVTRAFTRRIQSRPVCHTGWCGAALDVRTTLWKPAARQLSVRLWGSPRLRRVTVRVRHSRTAPLVASAMKLRANRENTSTSGSTASSAPAITMP